MLNELTDLLFLDLDEQELTGTLFIAINDWLVPTSMDEEFDAVSVSEALEPIDETSLKRAKEIICGGESWVEKTLRLSRRTVSASSSKG